MPAGWRERFCRGDSESVASQAPIGRGVMITGNEMSWSCPLAYQPITDVKKVPLYKQAPLSAY